MPLLRAWSLALVACRPATDRQETAAHSAASTAGTASPTGLDTSLHTASARSTSDTAGPGQWVLDLSPEQLWADGAGDQHHATVSAAPTGEGAVAWSDGESPAIARLRFLDASGTPGEPVVLHEPGTKPDVEDDGGARVVVAVQVDGDGLLVERLDLGATVGQTAPLAVEVDAQGNNSVDLARRPDGSLVAVWYDEGAVGTIRMRSLTADLVREPAFTETIATVDDATDLAADVEADDDGSVGVVWNEQFAGRKGDPDDTLYLDVFARDGARVEHVALDSGRGLTSPRRPSIAHLPSGWAVAWRERSVLTRPSSAFFEAFAADGTPRAAPVLLDPGVDTDEPVVEVVDAGHVWLVWTSVLASEGFGRIRGGVFAVPSGAVVVGPVDLSSSATAARGHTSVAVAPDGSRTLVVSWEEDDGAGHRTLRGRTGTLRLE